MTSGPYNLLLVGGGHAHVVVVREWAKARKNQEIAMPLPSSTTSSTRATPPPPLPPPKLALISEQPSSVYSGMLPGVIEGIYSPEEAFVPLQPLCDAAGFDLIVGEVASISSARGEVEVSFPSTSCSPPLSKKTLRYETLSIDVGSATEASIEGADFEGKSVGTFVALRPVSSLLERMKPLLDACDDSMLPPPSVVVVGGGAAGIEIAAAVAARIKSKRKREQRRHFVSLVSGLRGLLPDEGDAVASLLAARELERAGVELYDRARVVSCSKPSSSSPQSSGVVVEVEGNEENGRKKVTSLDADFVLFATGSAPHRWIRDRTDLPLDDVTGFIRVDKELRCRFEEKEPRPPSIFAAGDCARIIAFDQNENDSPPPSSPPKAGVYAVRAGKKVLYPNLRAAVFAEKETSQPASFWSPSSEGRAALALLSLGGKRALALWPWRRRKLPLFLPAASAGAWTWRLKDWIDRGWIQGR